jgi:hypothetical protein
MKMYPSRWTRLLLLLLLAAVLAFGVACGDDDDDDDADDDATPDDDDDATPDDDDDTTPGDDDDDTTPGDDDDDDDDDDDTVSPEELIDEGRMWLQIGIPERARQSFSGALAIDEASGEAHYGRVLACGLHDWELISTISTLLVDNHPEGKAIDVNRELLRQIIEMIQEGFFAPLGEQTRESAAWLAANGNPPFFITDVPILFNAEVVAMLGEEFDTVEREGSAALVNLFDGFGGMLLSLHLDINFNHVLDLEFGGDIMDIIAEIAGLIDAMLHEPGNEQNFLLDPDYSDQFVESRLNLGAGFAGFKAALVALRAETDDQTDDVIPYDDVNGNDVYDAGEPIVLPSLGALDEDEMALLEAIEDITFDLGKAFLDRTDMDIEPGVDNPFHASSLNSLLQYLGIPPLIPGFLTIDIAAVFEDLEEDSIRNFLETLLTLVELILPDAVAA